MIDEYVGINSGTYIKINIYFKNIFIVLTFPHSLKKTRVKIMQFKNLIIDRNMDFQSAYSKSVVNNVHTTQ